MFPIATILHPTDFSPASRAAFDVACSLARDQRARLVVLYVAPPPSAEGDPVEQPWDASKQKFHQLPVADPNIRVEYLVEHGDPEEAILGVARQIECSLIVMGSHGRSGLLDRLLLGSVAEMIVRRARCPVLVVKANAKPVASDGSTAKEAVR
jgi:nucleotide-binding universal stress UspA family protein